MKPRKQRYSKETYRLLRRVGFKYLWQWKEWVTPGKTDDKRTIEEIIKDALSEKNQLDIMCWLHLCNNWKKLPRSAWLRLKDKENVLSLLILNLYKKRILSEAEKKEIQ